MAARREPRWVTRRMLDAMHDAQLREHGGSPGVRDDGLLESALARPQQKWTCDESVDLAALAAAYAFGLVRNHGYVDGNKRAAFVAAYVFLALNGQEFDVDEAAVVDAMEHLAAGKLTEARMAEWLRAGLGSGS